MDSRKELEHLKKLDRRKRFKLFGIGLELYFGVLIARAALLPALWKADIEAHERRRRQ